MKKIIGGLIIVILGGSLILVLLNKNKDEIIDYTKIEEEQLFMNDIASYKNELNYFNANVDNYCIFKVVNQDDKPIKEAEILFDDGSSDEIILKTNSEGYAGISDLTKKDYGFEVKKMLGKEINTQEKIVDLSKEECSFIIKENKDTVEIEKLEIKRLKALNSLESTELKKSISYYKDEDIFLKEDFLGEKLSILMSNVISKDNILRYEYYVQISNAYILETEVKLKNPLKTQKIVNLEGEEQNVFKDEAGFSFVASEEEFKDSEAELIITFKMKDKIYKIKKSVILGQDFMKNRELQIKNNYNKAVHLEVNYLNIETGEEEKAKSFDLEAGYLKILGNLDKGNYVLNIFVDNKNEGSIYFIIEDNKRTYLTIN